MSDMRINNLSVDLLQESATIALFKQGIFQEGKNNFTSVNVSVPINAAGNQPEDQLRRSAVNAARKTLEDAIKALDNYIS